MRLPPVGCVRQAVVRVYDHCAGEALHPPKSQSPEDPIITRREPAQHEHNSVESNLAESVDVVPLDIILDQFGEFRTG